MPRDIPVSNGKLLVCFDNKYCIRDFYFSHVGQEKHSNGNCFRVGVWVDERFSWIGSEWKRELRYMSDTLVTNVSLYNENLGLLIICSDAVDFHEDIYIWAISVENMRPTEGKSDCFSAMISIFTAIA